MPFGPIALQLLSHGLSCLIDFGTTANIDPTWDYCIDWTKPKMSFKRRWAFVGVDAVARSRYSAMGALYGKRQTVELVVWPRRYVKSYRGWWVDRI